MRFIILFFILLISAGAWAQSSKKKKGSTTNNTQQGSPTSLEPYYPPTNFGPKKNQKKRKSKGPTYTAEQEFYERIEDLDKTRRKNERMMEKPQYSDPMYFGHKRPPRKRAPEKMKFCKVCGIRH